MSGWVERWVMMSAGLGVLACGGEGDGGGHGGVSPDLERYLSGLCQKAVECGRGSGSETADDCVDSLMTNFCDPVYQDLTLSGLDACLAALDCDYFAGLSAGPLHACQGVTESLLGARGYTVA